MLEKSEFLTVGYDTVYIPVKELVGNVMSIYL